MSPGHLVSFLDKTFCMEPILHCIFKPQGSNLGLLYLHHYMVTSKLASASLLTTLVQGGGTKGIYRESHVKGIDAWIMIASDRF